MLYLVYITAKTCLKIAVLKDRESEMKEKDVIKVQKIVVGIYVTNSYIVSGRVSGRCILIDPADDAERMIAQLAAQKLTPEAVLLTHGHYDHFLAVPALQEKWPELPVFCHLRDCPEEKEEYDMGMVFPTVAALQHVTGIQEGQVLKLAGFEITVYHTPGHTKGSVLFLIGNILFTGDTLFRGSIGRTDFAGGNDVQMQASLYRIAKFEGDYKVYPGHEEPTTLAEEKMYNPYLERYIE